MTQRKTILQLLSEFAKQPGCDRYSADSERINLLVDYLWLRQLCPSLPFETFLQHYAPVADYDEENMKHPRDALALMCPRHSKTAAKLGVRQWAAHEVVDITSLYVDMIRTAEATGQPIQVGLKDFLTHASAPFLAGQFGPPREATEPADAAPAPAATKKPRKKAAAAGDPETPQGIYDRQIVENDLVIYTSPSGRQFRGRAKTIHPGEEGRAYVDFVTLDGEEMPGLAITHFRKVTPEEVNLTAADLADKSPVSVVPIVIPPAEAKSASSALAMTSPMANIGIGQVVYAFQALTPAGAAVISVTNGEHGPYVDPSLFSSTGSVLSSLPPRKHLNGTYDFSVNREIHRVEVRT